MSIVENDKSMVVEAEVSRAATVWQDMSGATPEKQLVDLTVKFFTGDNLTYLLEKASKKVESEAQNKEEPGNRTIVLLRKDPDKDVQRLGLSALQHFADQEKTFVPAIQVEIFENLSKSAASLTCDIDCTKAKLNCLQEMFGAMFEVQKQTEKTLFENVELKGKLKETAAVVKTLIYADVVTEAKLKHVEAKTNKLAEERAEELRKVRELAEQESEKLKAALEKKLADQVLQNSELEKAHEIKITALREGLKNEALNKIKAVFDLD